jgi:hypothetical protein
MNIRALVFFATLYGPVMCFVSGWISRPSTRLCEVHPRTCRWKPRSICDGVGEHRTAMRELFPALFAATNVFDNMADDFDRESARKGLQRWAAYFRAQNITRDFDALLASMQTPAPIDLRLNTHADLHVVLRQQLQNTSEKDQKVLEPIAWYPQSGCAWRFRPSLEAQTQGGVEETLVGENDDGQEGEESPPGNQEGVEGEEGGWGMEGERDGDDGLSEVGVGGWDGKGLRGLLVEQQNRGALARQEYVSLLPVVVLGTQFTCLTGTNVQILTPGVLLGEVRAEDKVLDVCASPGSKSSQLLGLHPHFRGLLIANELDRRRLGRLHHRLQKECPSQSVVITNFDARFFPLFRGLQVCQYLYFCTSK